MRVRFCIPGPLRALTGGHSQVELESSGTLQDALAALFQIHPGMRARILTEQGNIREHVNVFIGNEDARSTGGLTAPLRSGAEISIIPAISGG